MLEGEEGEDMMECWREIYSGHGNGVVEVWNNQRRMEYEEERRLGMADLERRDDSVGNKPKYRLQTSYDTSC